MSNIEFNFRRPGLLVSVRNLAEAQTALAAGADIIDVKEPNRGSLGAADAGEIAAIVQAVKSRVPVTAAMGELVDLDDTQEAIERVARTSNGLSLFKFGLAGCGSKKSWQTRWAEVVSACRDDSRPFESQPVAVAYADWQAAHAPQPQEVLNSGVRLGCPALLIDTWDKSAGGLLDHWPEKDLQNFVHRVQREGMLVVLAGALAGDQIRQAAALGPDCVAVRGAACENGRSSAISFDRVRELKQALTTCAFPETVREKIPSAARSGEFLRTLQN